MFTLLGFMKNYSLWKGKLRRKPKKKMGLQLKMGCDIIPGVLGKQGMNNRFEFTRFYYYFGFSGRSGFAYA